MVDFTEYELLWRKCHCGCGSPEDFKKLKQMEKELESNATESNNGE